MTTYDNETIGRLMLILMGGTMGLMPLLILVAGVTATIQKRRALRTYVPVDAIVLSQEVVETRGDDATWYKPRIQYAYEVLGVRYRSTNIRSGSSSEYAFSRKEAQRIADSYPVGGHIEAFHDPEAPASAFLIKRHPFLHEHLLTLLGGFGVAFLFGGSWFLGVFWQLIGAMLLTVLCIVAWICWQTRKNKHG